MVFMYSDCASVCVRVSYVRFASKTISWGEQIHPNVETMWKCVREWNATANSFYPPDERAMKRPERMYEWQRPTALRWCRLCWFVRTGEATALANTHNRRTVGHCFKSDRLEISSGACLYVRRWCRVALHGLELGRVWIRVVSMSEMLTATTTPQNSQRNAFLMKQKNSMRLNFNFIYLFYIFYIYWILPRCSPPLRFASLNRFKFDTVF